MQNNYSKRNRTYLMYDKWLMKEINEAQDDFIMGRDVDKSLALWNMFFLLMRLRNEDYPSICPDEKLIDCMSNKLFCFDIDTSDMEELWPLNCYKDDSISLLDGIGYMQLEGNGIQYSKFRIR